MSRITHATTLFSKLEFILGDLLYNALLLENILEIMSHTILRINDSKHKETKDSKAPIARITNTITIFSNLI